MENMIKGNRGVRILFLTQTNIGDVILSTVLLDRMLADYPDATVDVVAGARAVDIFKGMPQLGALIPLVKKRRHGHYLDLWRKLRGHRYDYIVDLRGTLLPLFLSGRKKIRFSNANKKVHKGVQLAALYPSDKAPQQRIWVSDEQRAGIMADVSAAKARGPLIGLGPTANWIGKCWPQRKFALLSQMLREIPGYENAQFVLFGAEQERTSVMDLIHFIPERCRVDLVGKTSLTEACAWMEQLDVFIGNDSGLSHMAAAAGVPTITLFGPTPDHLYHPMTTKGKLVIAPERSVVNLEPTAPKRVITDIKPEHVVTAFKELLNIDRQSQGENVRHA